MINWAALHDDKDLRRKHYIDLYFQTFNIDLFIRQLQKGFEHRLPCKIFFDCADDIVQMEVWAIPEIPDSGADVLDWVGSWAAARKLQIQDRMSQMSERWPYLDALLQEVVKKSRILKFPIDPRWYRRAPWKGLGRAFKSIFGRSRQSP